VTDAEAPRSVVTPTREGSVLALLVTPRAGKTAVDGIADGALRVRLAAPPVDGAANDALIRFLAETFALPKERVRLVGGARSRRKRVALDGLPAEAVVATLAARLRLR
jgi:uncharacterized protein (TIGR00251 family)